jgi:hypothetical protein
MPDIKKQTELNTLSIAVIQNDMNYIKTQLDNLVKSLAELRVEYAAKNEVQSLEKRVSDMEDKWSSWSTWITRLVAGMIIVGLIGLLITQGK